jgi:chaperonin GroEL
LDKLVPQQLHSFLGKARTVTVSKDKTTIVDGRGEEAAIEARAESLKEQIDNAQSFYEKEKLQERLGKLIGGVAIVSVGGNSEVEMKEKKDRVEDALFATKAALEQGIVPGGGLSLIRAFNAAIYDVDSTDDNTIRGFKILKKACYAPFIKILDNAGQDNWYEVLHEVLNGGDDDNFLIYNVKTSTIANAITEGLLDPVKVTRTALENAASVAGTILTTESVVFEKRDEKKKDEGFDMSSLGM